MRVLIISQYFWPETFPINDLATGLRDKGHFITILTGKPNYPSGKYYPGYGLFATQSDNLPGIAIKRVPLISRGRGGKVRLTLNYASFAFFASILGPIICKESYDVIFVYEPSPITVGLPALVIKSLRGAPVMFWVQDLWPESLSATSAVQSKLVLRWVERLVKFIYKGCDLILVQSKSFATSISELGINGCRIKYFPNSASDTYRPVNASANSQEDTLMPSGFRIVFAGNLGAAQDFPTILAAVEQLRSYENIHWIILGDGRMSSWLKEQIEHRQLTKHFHLLGRFPVESMPRFFALADVLLVTLRQEPIFAMTIPAKVQSYLACAKPIIGGLEGEGARVVEESGAGIVCHSGEPEALANAVLRMYHMTEEERHNMGHRGRDYYMKHFDRATLLDQVEGWMKDLSRSNICEY